MRSAIKTKDRIVHAAMELFHLNGIKGTSVDDILKRSKTGKGQFTHYFKNKDGLVLAVVAYLQELIRSGQVDSNYSIKSWKDFNTWFKRYINFQKITEYELSCPLGTIGNDLTEEQTHLRLAVKTFFEWSTEQLAIFFTERKAAGDLPSSVSPAQLADLCMCVMEGGMLMTKICRSSKAFENAASQVIVYIKMLRRYS